MCRDRKDVDRRHQKPPKPGAPPRANLREATCGRGRGPGEGQRARKTGLELKGRRGLRDQLGPLAPVRSPVEGTGQEVGASPLALVKCHCVLVAQGS